MTLLDAVRDAKDLRDRGRTELAAAIVAASAAGHSLAQIGRAAGGMTKSGVRAHLLRADKRKGTR